jgi:hypothetical protein
MTDLSAAALSEDAFARWPEGVGFTVGDFVPRGFEADARILHLLRGPLDALLRWSFGGWWQPPNLWWPDDHAWCVATEVDGYDTFIGGSGSCIDEVVERSALEAFRIDPDYRFGPVDPSNPAPWDPDPLESDRSDGL